MKKIVILLIAIFAMTSPLFAQDCGGHEGQRGFIETTSTTTISETMPGLSIIQAWAVKPLPDYWHYFVVTSISVLEKLNNDLKEAASKNANGVYWAVVLDGEPLCPTAIEGAIFAYSQSGNDTVKNKVRDRLMMHKKENHWLLTRSAIVPISSISADELPTFLKTRMMTPQGQQNNQGQFQQQPQQIPFQLLQQKATPAQKTAQPVEEPSVM